MSATGLTYHRRVASAATAPVKHNSPNNFPKHRTQRRVHSMRAFLLLFSLFSISLHPPCDVYALSTAERMSHIGSHHDSHGERTKQVNRHGERVCVCVKENRWMCHVYGNSRNTIHTRCHHMDKTEWKHMKT